METKIKRIQHAKEPDHKYFFHGDLNVEFEVMEWFTYAHILWMYNDAKHLANQQGGLSANVLYYEGWDKVVAVKSHYSTIENHHDYCFPSRDMDDGVVTMKLAKRVDAIQFPPVVENSKSIKESRYFFEGIPNPDDKVLNTISSSEVLELLESVQQSAHERGGYATPIFEDDWNGNRYRLIDSVPHHYLEGNAELNRVANFLHMITIQVID